MVHTFGYLLHNYESEVLVDAAAKLYRQTYDSRPDIHLYRKMIALDITIFRELHCIKKFTDVVDAHPGLVDDMKNMHDLYYDHKPRSSIK
jgi:hypothetical protein